MGTNYENVEVLVNRAYKDTIFRMLFKDKENLLSLYNAVNGTAYDEPEKLEIVTLENAVYMSMKNVHAFILDCQMRLNGQQKNQIWN